MKDKLKKTYTKEVKESIKEKDDRSKSLSYYDDLKNFYDCVKNSKDIKNIDVFKKGRYKTDIMNLEKILDSRPDMSLSVMPNKEVRFRVVDGVIKSSFVITDASEKELGGSPHQNSHEHFFVSEICRVNKGCAIAATLLPNNLAKLQKYRSGEFWVSTPGVTHNTSLYDGTCTTTFKTPSPIQDWYGTGNVVNSLNAYTLDSYTKTLELDEMAFIINHYNGIINEKIIRMFNMEERWQEELKNYDISPYEVLITPENREIMEDLLIVSKTNDAAAFYAILTNNAYKTAYSLAFLYADDVNLALSRTEGKESFDVERARDFIKQKKLIRK